jgi:hypothetical protein
LSRCAVPVADDVVDLVFDQIEIESDYFPHNTAESAEVLGLPLAKMSGFLIREVLFFVLGRVVHAMSELVAKKRCQLASPKPSAVFGKLDGTAQIGQHGVECTGLYHEGKKLASDSNRLKKNSKKLERDKRIELSPPPWQGGVLPLYESR